MVIRHLFAVQHPVKLRGFVQSRRKGKQRQQAGHDAFQPGLHIIGQILAVRAGVGQPLLFIELLGVIKGLLGGKSKQAVGLPLQGCEVVKTWRLLCLFLPRHGNTKGLLPSASRFQAGRFFGAGKAAAGRLHAARCDMDNVIFLFLKTADFRLSVNQHFQGRRLDTAHGQGLVV